MPDPKLKHSGYIENEVTWNEYIAKCCCDWEGPDRLTLAEAEADLAKHMVAAA